MSPGTDEGRRFSAALHFLSEQKMRAQSLESASVFGDIRRLLSQSDDHVFGNLCADLVLRIGR